MTEARVGALPPAPAEPAEPPLTDWTLRLFAAGGRSPLWVGLGVLVGVTGVSHLLRMVVTVPTAGPFYTDPYLWLDLLNGVLMVYIPIALVYLRRGRIQDLRALRPLLACDDAGFARRLEQMLCVRPARLALSGAIGALALGAMPLLDPGFWGGGPRPPLVDPLLWVMVVRSALTGWLSGHAIVSEAQVTLALGRIGREDVRIDLLDLEPLAGFARANQRGAFAWVLASFLVSLFWLGPAVGVSNAVIVGSLLVLVSVSFFVSIQGVHQNISATKRRALAVIDARLRPRARALLAGEDPGDGDPRLADLVAFHGFVQGVREWPLGVPALLRGVLIAGLAVGSWLGGAVVENLLDRVLQ